VRVDSGNHWAEISEEPFTWGQRNRIRDAADGPFFASFATTLVAQRVTSWSEEGDPTDPASWEAVDDKFGDAVLTAALETWKDAPDPNAPSGESKSSPSPQDSESETPTPS
jgi:hypothetical protein